MSQDDWDNFLFMQQYLRKELPLSRRTMPPFKRTVQNSPTKPKPFNWKPKIPNRWPNSNNSNNRFANSAKINKIGRD